jgi:NADPH:quinone reductase-like Zn-dependent oxidoreductase
MKAAVLHSADSVPVYGDFAEPEAGPGTEIVGLVAAGIHHVTRSVATGRHYSRDGAFPVIPGLNAVGRTAAGELVFTSSGQPPYGTFAERMPSPDAMRFPLPAGASPEAVAAGVNPGMGSWLPLQARLAETDKLGTVLVLGATGITGYLAVQNALLLGAERVIGAGRSESGLERAAAAGARTVAISGDAAADVTALAAAVEASGPMLVLDFVWGPVAETAFRALASAKFGEDDSEVTYVQIGSLAGLEAAVPSPLLRSRRITISGSGAGSVSGAEIRAQIPRYIELIANGSVDVPFRTFPLSDIGTAWTESAKSGPRVVVVPG